MIEISSSDREIFGFLMKRTVRKSAFFLAAAAVLLVCSFFSGRRDRLLSEEGVRTRGTIVALQREPWWRIRRRGSITGTRQRRRYFPVVEFTDENGTPRRVVTTETPASLLFSPVGSQATVVYVRSNPEIAEIAIIHGEREFPTMSVSRANPRPGFRPDTVGALLLFAGAASGLFGLYHVSGPLGEWFWDGGGGASSRRRRRRPPEGSGPQSRRAKKRS